MNTCSNVCIRVEGSETLSRTNIRSQTPKGPRVSKACCRAATACATAYARPVLIGPGVPWRRQCLGSLMSRECCPRRASQRLISPILLVRARALQGGGGGAASSGGSARVAGNRKGTVRPKPCSACPVLRAPLCAARCRGIVDVNNLSACVWSASRVCRRPRPTGSCSSPSSSSPASPWSWCVRLSSCAAAGKAHGFGRECTRNTLRSSNLLRSRACRHTVLSVDAEDFPRAHRGDTLRRHLRNHGPASRLVAVRCHAPPRSMPPTPCFSCHLS